MEIVLVFLILAGALTLFITEKFRVDLTALLVLGALLLVAVIGQQTGWIDPAKWISVRDGFAGFSNSAVLTVAAMFVLSSGLERTGALHVVGRALGRLSRRPALLLLVMMVLAGGMSAFVNNTAAVAVLLPVVLAVCARCELPASRFLIPLSFAAQFGGVCTLIGTSTNLLVASIAEKAGLAPLRMFEFTPLGLCMMVAGIVYLMVFGRWLLPARRGGELVETYQLREYLTEIRVMPESPLVGKTVRESGFGERHDVTVLEIVRERRKIWSFLQEPMRAGDLLLVQGKLQSLLELRASAGIEIEPEFKLRDAEFASPDTVLVEALVAPRSLLAGRTLAESDFRRRFDMIVLAVQRQGQVLRDKLVELRLRFGDALLLLVQRSDLARLRANRQLIVLSEVDATTTQPAKALLATSIIAVAVILAATNVVPILVGALLGGLLLILTRCLTIEQVYEAIDWQVIVLLAGLLPLGLAMERSGAARLLAQQIMRFTGDAGPAVVLAAIYLVTAILTEFMSNNAAAVLIAPIAISTAANLGVDARPFLVAVVFAASTSFSTPVGYQTNTMVYSAGGYRFSDFLKIGVPLNLLFWVLAVWLIPRFWPF